MKKLKSILLIDDDEPTNFINKKRIKQAEVCENILVQDDGESAIELLNKLEKEGQSLPELIFLDINMPGMNGWEFLEEFKNLSSVTKENIVVVMLTTSLNVDDRKKAEAIEEISDFINKPFLIDQLHNILTKHFEFEIR